MDININGLHGHALTVIGRALVEIGEIQEREREQFRSTFQAADAARLIRNVASDLAEQAQEAPAPAAEEKPAKKPRPKKEEAAASAEAPTPDTSAGASTPAATATPASPSEAAVTLVDVRAKLAALSQAGKAAEVKALLTKFGVAKLTDLASDRYGELMAAAEEI